MVSVVLFDGFLYFAGVLLHRRPHFPRALLDGNASCLALTLYRLTRRLGATRDGLPGLPGVSFDNGNRILGIPLDGGADVLGVLFEGTSAARSSVILPG